MGRQWGALLVGVGLAATSCRWGCYDEVIVQLVVDADSQVAALGEGVVLDDASCLAVCEHYLMTPLPTACDVVEELSDTEFTEGTVLNCTAEYLCK